MSERLWIALVGEGPTDKIVIEAAIANLLGARPFVLKQLQPEESKAFGKTGAGWPGVYKWCHQAATNFGGQLRNHILFERFRLLVLHLDADVASEHYSDAGIDDLVNDLPCAQPCPPPEQTTNALRVILLRWAGERDTPPRTVLCTPSKSSETWVLCALYPTNRAVASENVECNESIEGVLQGMPAATRLISGGRKHVDRYMDRAPEITSAWPAVRARCNEAQRFSTDFTSSVPTD
jgi:hypothetical protein